MSDWARSNGEPWDPRRESLAEWAARHSQERQMRDFDPSREAKGNLRSACAKGRETGGIGSRRAAGKRDRGRDGRWTSKAPRQPRGPP